MNDDTLMTFIGAQHPFDHLSDDELSLIQQTVKTATYAPDDYILTQNGAPSQYLFVIHQGAVRLVRDERTILVLEEGECFGYASLVNQSPPAADIVAEEELTVLLISQQTFEQLIENSAFAEFFLKNLGERLRLSPVIDMPSLGGGLTTPVGMLVVRPPVLLSPASTVAEAAKAMRKAWVDVAIIMDNPPGIVTDHDFQTKVLAEELEAQTPVRQVMSRPVKMMSEDTPVHGALLYMLEEDIHHLPVKTENGDIVGIITATDLLRHHASSPLYFMRYLEQLSGGEALVRYSLEIASTIENLHYGGLDIAQIGRVIASLNDTLIRRLLKLAERKLGPPPTPYAWLVFGSEGRAEQAILTDQDNALAYQDDTPEAKDYFDVLSQYVIDGLIQAGFPPCPGGYMATNWHKPIQTWIDLFEKWIRTPSPQALLETAIFFDFRPVHGDLSVKPLDNVVIHAADNEIFLAHLAKSAMEFRPPLGFFRRILAQDGQVDLKAGGVAPIVSLARVYALAAHSPSRSTFERLEVAAKAGTISQEGSETLAETYRFLLQLRLREQLKTLRAGKLPNNKIRLDALSSREKQHLKEAFVAIREMQEATTSRYRTEMLG